MEISSNKEEKCEECVGILQRIGRRLRSETANATANSQSDSPASVSVSEKLLRELYEERAAIKEYEGNMPPEYAERQAAMQIGGEIGLMKIAHDAIVSKYDEE